MIIAEPMSQCPTVLMYSQTIECFHDLLVYILRSSCKLFTWSSVSCIKNTCKLVIPAQKRQSKKRFSKLAVPKSYRPRKWTLPSLPQPRSEKLRLEKRWNIAAIVLYRLAIHEGLQPNFWSIACADTRGGAIKLAQLACVYRFLPPTFVANRFSLVDTGCSFLTANWSTHAPDLPSFAILFPSRRSLYNLFDFVYLSIQLPSIHFLLNKSFSHRACNCEKTDTRRACISNRYRYFFDLSRGRAMLIPTTSLEVSAGKRQTNWNAIDALRMCFEIKGENELDSFEELSRY